MSKSTSVSVQVPTKSIVMDSSFNCRGEIETQSPEWQSFVLDIQRRGIDVPITVEEIQPGSYKCLAGHRRLTAVLSLGWDVIPAVVRQNLTDEDRELINIQENLQRSNLTFVQEAALVSRFSRRGLTIQAVADKLSMSKSWVMQRVNFSRFPKIAQDKLGEANVDSATLRRLHAIYVNSPRLPNSTTPDIREFMAEVDKFYNSRGNARGRAYKPREDADPDAVKERVRSRAELQSKLVAVRRATEGREDIIVKVMEWAAGAVSDNDLDEALRLHYEELGMFF